jgi:hypothetical protein
MAYLDSAFWRTILSMIMFTSPTLSAMGWPAALETCLGDLH